MGKRKSHGTRFFSSKAAAVLALSAALMTCAPQGAEATSYTNLYYGWGSAAYPYTAADQENSFSVTSGSGRCAIKTDGSSTNVTIIATAGSNTAVNSATSSSPQWWGISNYWGTLNLQAAQDNVFTGYRDEDRGIGAWRGGTTALSADRDNIISAAHYGVYSSSAYAWGAVSHVIVTASRDNVITSEMPRYVGYTNNNAVSVLSNGAAVIRSLHGNNRITASADASVRTSRAVAVNYGKYAVVEALEGSNYFTAGSHVLLALRGGSLDVTAADSNYVRTTRTSGETQGIQAGGRYGEYFNSVVSLCSIKGSNHFSAAGTDEYIGIYASHPGSSVLVSALAGDNEFEKGLTGVEAVDSSEVKITAEKGSNIFGDFKFGLWSHAGSKVTVQGQTRIKGSAAAIMADMRGTGSSGDFSGENPQIVLNYDGSSEVNGDLIAHGSGVITARPTEDSAFTAQKIDINGSLLAYGRENDPLDSTSGDSCWDGGTIGVELTAGSTFTGTAAVYEQTGDYGTGRAGTVNLTLAPGSRWVITGSSSVTSLANNGTVHFQNGGAALTAETISGAGTYDLDLSTNGRESDMIYAVNGTDAPQVLVVKNLAALNGEMKNGSAVRFATIKNSGGGFSDGTVLAVIPDGLNNDTLQIQYRDYTADPLNTPEYNEACNGGPGKPGAAETELRYGGSGAKNIYVVKNAALNDGALAPGAALPLSWRSITAPDTYLKRRSQARFFSAGNNGNAWFRTQHQKNGVSGTGSLSGNTWEAGYDWLIHGSSDQLHTLGFSLNWTRQSGHFDTPAGSLRLRGSSVALYDTHEYGSDAAMAGRGRSYWDNSLKISRYKNEYDVTDRITGIPYHGDGRRSVTALNTEYGLRIPVSSRLYWTPQAQFQASYAGSFSFTDSQNLRISGDHGWSLIGRLGADLTWIADAQNDTRLYLKASVLHEFLDCPDTTVAAGSTEHITKGTGSGTWTVLGIGCSARFSASSYFFADCEWNTGNDFDDSFTLTAGLHFEI